MFTDENVQRYAKGLYPIAALLILVPLVDLSLRTFPPQFGTLQWRFATVGLLIGNTGTVLLGTGLLGLVAVIAGHRRFLRVLGFITLGLAVALLAVVVLFTLDAVQIRRLANQNFKRAVFLSSVGAMTTGLLGILALAGIGRGALSASRVTRAVAGRKKPASPIVVGPRTAAAEVAVRPGATESA
jgi:hypothetical protein